MAVVNGFDPNNKALTIGHPKVAQVDLLKSFGTEDHTEIWRQLNDHLDVYKIQTDQCEATYNYHWSDADFQATTDPVHTRSTKMNWIKNLYHRIRLEIRYRRKLKELRKRDPFIYK
jgi:hypothetical protein